MCDNLIQPHPFGREITADSLRRRFAVATAWEEKYRLLILIGKQLPLLPDALRQQNIAIAGCESRVWFAHQRQADGGLHFYGDSDSRIVKGLLAVLLTAVEGKTPTQLCAADPLDLFDCLELRHKLTHSRGQGLAALVGYVRQSAQRYLA